VNSNRTSGGFDLDFRPASYFVHRNPAPALLQNIKGDLRRAVARDALGADRDIDPRFYEEDAPLHFRDRLERIDPRWMGGEYLPAYDEGEVEIARLVLASGTLDVYSVRARWAGNALRYRIVDEYETDWYLTREKSERPLSMGELIELIDGATFSNNEWDDLTDALRDAACGDDAGASEAVDFVRVTSELYPQLEQHYAAKAAAWLERRAPDSDEG
jgi:hypothetical protein